MLHVAPALQQQHNDCRQQRKTELTAIKMSRYPFQGVYNHVCWICHPIKREQHYPASSLGLRWNTLTFTRSRWTRRCCSLCSRSAASARTLAKHTITHAGHIFATKWEKRHFFASHFICSSLLIVCDKMDYRTLP